MGVCLAATAVVLAAHAAAPVPPESTVRALMTAAAHNMLDVTT